MNKLNVLGINISDTNKKEVLEKIEEFFLDGRSHQIVTPNPEFLLAAQDDEEFFHILNNADLAIPDGIGLKIASWFLGKNSPPHQKFWCGGVQRISGADLVKDILRLAEDRGLRVGIINWNGGLSSADDIRSALKEKYPKLNVEVEDKEFVIPASEPGSMTMTASTNGEFSGFRVKPGMTNEFVPDILFCTFGAPEQDKFIFHALEQMPSAHPHTKNFGVGVKLGMGVGGSFDFLTGKIRRAPRALRFLGLEWLWRLAMQRWRWKRILNAVIIFPAKFLKWRFILPFLYRENVVCMLYKKENGRFKTLLVERAEQQGHWQLPQGGMDGEDVATAGLRELREEVGVNQFGKIIALNNLYQYEFGEKIGKYGVKTKTVMGYRGQKQNLLIAEFLGSDAEIKINFWDHSAWKWVDAENLVNEVHPVRREATKIFLEKFNNLITHNA